MKGLVNMKEVRVLVDSLKDKTIFDKEIEVKRNGKTIKIKQQLLMKNDIYTISAKRYNKLVKDKIVEKVKKEPANKTLESENKGE